MLYTIDVNKFVDYSLTFNISGNAGTINVYVNDQLIFKNISVAASNDENTFVVSRAMNIHLNKGRNKIKVAFKKGGFNLKNLRFKL